MKVSYRIKFLDIILFSIYHWFHSPFILGFFAVLIGIITWVNWQAMAERANEYSLFVLTFSFVVLELLFFAVLRIVLLLTVVVGNLSKWLATLVK